MPDETQTATVKTSPKTNQPGGVTPPDVTAEPSTATSTDTAQTSAPLGYEEAGALLDQAGDAPARRERNALADDHDADPLADSEETDPLAAELDEALSEETTEEATEETTEETETTEEETTEDPAEEETTPEETAELPTRLKLNLSKMAPRDAAIILEAKRSNCSLAQAEANLFGTAAREETATETTEEETPVVSSADILARIKQLRADRQQIGDDFTKVKESRELSEQIEQALIDLTDAREREAQARVESTSRAASHAESVQQSVTAMGKAYPDSLKTGTPLHDAVLAEKRAKEKANPSFFNDPDWPETLVRKHAARLGIAEIKAKAALKTVPKKAAHPVPATGGRSATPTSLTEAQLSEKIRVAKESGDAETLDRLLAGEIKAEPASALT